MSVTSRNKLNAIRNNAIQGGYDWVLELNKYIYNNGTIPLVNGNSIMINGVDINAILTSMDIDDVREYLKRCGEFYANFIDHDGAQFMKSFTRKQAKEELKLLHYICGNKISWDLLKKHFIPSESSLPVKEQKGYGEFKYDDRSRDTRFSIPSMYALEPASGNFTPLIGIYHFTYGEDYKFTLNSDSTRIRIRIHSENLGRNVLNNNWSISIEIDGEWLGYDFKYHSTDQIAEVHLSPDFTNTKEDFRDNIIKRIEDKEVYGLTPIIRDSLLKYHLRADGPLS